MQDFGLNQEKVSFFFVLRSLFFSGYLILKLIIVLGVLGFLEFYFGRYNIIGVKCCDFGFDLDFLRLGFLDIATGNFGSQANDISIDNRLRRHLHCLLRSRSTSVISATSFLGDI